MKEATILKTGIAGSIFTAICCFTPVLVIVFGVVGLSAWLGWADYVLFPMLAMFIGMTAYALWRRQRAATCCATEIHRKNERG